MCGRQSKGKKTYFLTLRYTEFFNAFLLMSRIPEQMKIGFAKMTSLGKDVIFFVV
jgi:hypothetical protein